MEEKWQLYDEQGHQLTGQGAGKDAVYGKGLLHGAAHVWIWRKGENGTEILLQKRAAEKRTWPNRYDISAAGHIDLGESPVQAAIRETREEIGLNVKETDLRHIGVQRTYLVAENGSIENEFQWLYTLQTDSNIRFILQKTEVATLEWKPLAEFKKDIENDTREYVPHGKIYYETIIKAIEPGINI